MSYAITPGLQKCLPTQAFQTTASNSSMFKEACVLRVILPRISVLTWILNVTLAHLSGSPFQALPPARGMGTGIPSRTPLASEQQSANESIN